MPAYPEPPAACDRALDGATFERGEKSVCSTTSYEIGDGAMLAGTVKVFDVDGGSIALPTPIENLSEPRGLLFEETTKRLYQINWGSSLVRAYEPDGTPATGLAIPAFPNLNRPSAIAYRPF